MLWATPRGTRVSAMRHASSEEAKHVPENPAIPSPKSSARVTRRSTRAKLRQSPTKRRPPSQGRPFYRLSGGLRHIVQGLTTLLRRQNQKRKGCRRVAVSAAASAARVSILTKGDVVRNT